MFRRVSDWWKNRKAKPSQDQNDTGISSDSSASSDVSSDKEVTSESSSSVRSPEYTRLQQLWKNLDSRVSVLRGEIAELNKTLLNIQDKADRKYIEDQILSKEMELFDVLGEKIKTGKQLQLMDSEATSQSSNTDSSSLGDELPTNTGPTSIHPINDRRGPKILQKVRRDLRTGRFVKSRVVV